MKKLMVVLAVAVSVFLISGLAYAETYTAITPDNEVETVGEVIVERSTPATTEQLWSGNSIAQEIATIQGNIAIYQATIADWEAWIVELQMMQPLIEEQAKKVKLKVK